MMKGIKMDEFEYGYDPYSWEWEEEYPEP